MISVDDLKGWAAAAAVLAVIGIVIALRRYASVITVVDSTRERDKERREWQKAIVHQVMHESDMETLSLSEIRELYSKKVAHFKDVIGEETAPSELALRRAIIELLSSGVIGQTNHDEYFIFSHEQALQESVLVQ